jgi:putative ABC transport system ATP-binding protein
MLMQPDLLLCDEPTGNLDAQTGAQIVEVFRKLHATAGLTVVGVTHDELLTGAATRIVRMQHGRLVGEEAGPESEQAKAGSEET